MADILRELTAFLVRVRANMVVALVYQHLCWRWCRSPTWYSPSPIL